MRVFLSSTFRDMGRERDVLAKSIFPQLRERCRERHIEFVEVDLRWGITEEQSQRGEVLEICLAEIDLCRPYFIALLGERYGSILTDRVEGGLATGKISATEAEILHALNAVPPSIQPRQFFYFRDPRYIETLPQKDRSNHAAENESSAAKLRGLKAMLRATKVFLREDYRAPEELGQWILEDLWNAIEADFPAIVSSSSEEIESSIHAAFGARLATSYVSRSSDLAALSSHADRGGRILAVGGKSGVGKSSLLAYWAQRRVETNPEDFVFLHHVGATPDSAAIDKMLRRLLVDLRSYFCLEPPLPEDEQEFPAVVNSWLKSASERALRDGKRIILLFDGIERLITPSYCNRVSWLPQDIPPAVLISVSTSADDVLEGLRHRGCDEYQIPLLPVEERIALMEQYLALYRKQLSPRQVARLINPDATGNPLHLKLLLGELRLLGEYDDLDARIEHYLRASSISDLYSMILERLELDYEGERPGLVEATSQYLWASRSGLLEVELLELLRREGETSLPRLIWSPLYLSLQEALTWRSGVLSFANSEIRSAIEQRYFFSPDTKLKVHGLLAEYFRQKSPLDLRLAHEWLWQTEQTRNWRDLNALIFHPGVFYLLPPKDIYAYWRKLPEDPELKVSFERALGTWRSLQEEWHFSEEELALLIAKLGGFLSETCGALLDDAEILYKTAIDTAERVIGHDALPTLLMKHNLANLLADCGRYTEAETLYRVVLIQQESRLEPDHPDLLRSMSNLGFLLARMGRPADALSLLQTAMERSERRFGFNHPLTLGCAEDAIQVLGETGAWEEADNLQLRFDLAMEVVHGAGHSLPRNPGTLSGLYSDVKSLPEAEAEYRRAIADAVRTVGEDHKSTLLILNNLADNLRRQSKLPEAEQILRRVVAIQSRLLGPQHPDTLGSRHNLGVTLLQMGTSRESASILSQVVEARLRLFGHQDVGTLGTIYNFSLSLAQQGQFARAEALLRGAEEQALSHLGQNHPLILKIHEVLEAVISHRISGVAPFWQ